MHATNCLNCESPLLDAQKYCPECGQKTNIHRLNFHEISHEIIHYVVHVDKSIFNLLKELAIRPGIVAREFVTGKRQKHFRPLNFFMIVAGIVVFMTSLFYTANDTRSRQMQQAAEHIKDPVRKQNLLDMADRTKKVNVITQKYSNVINMVATPLLTLVFWLFYRRQYNYVESLTANMYFVGFIMLFYALLIVPLQHYFPKTGTAFIGAFFLFEFAFRGFAYYQFANKKDAWPAIKAYGISLLLSVFWVALTYALIVKYIRTGF
jgi:hypothetical protein